MADKPRRIRNRGIAHIPRITLPKPSGHTETLWETLRDAREKLDMGRGDLVELLKRDFDIEVTDSAIQAWEVGRNEPSMGVHARWARCVGKRLDVQILDANEDTQAVHVPPEVADLAASLTQLRPSKIGAAEVIIEALLSMTPGEVKALAFDLAARTKE